MPTTVTKTVKSAGGDYTSLAGWEAGEQGDIVSADEIRQAECYSFSDTAAFTVDGWTTDATRYIRIFTQAAERHLGVWNTAKYRLETTSGTCITLVENDTRIEGLQIYQNEEANGVRGITFTGADRIQISKNLIKANVAYDKNQIGLYNENAGSANKIWNNIIYDFSRSTSYAMSIAAGFTQKIAVYNNTIHNCVTGIYDGGIPDRILAKNNIFRSCGTNASGTLAAGTDYNATDDAAIGYTVTGSGNTHDRLSQTFTFVDEAGDNFQLASADAGAQDFGVDLSADANLAFSDDIIGTARPQGSAWDIGASEVIAAAGGLAIPIVFQRRRSMQVV